MLTKDMRSKGGASDDDTPVQNSVPRHVSFQPFSRLELAGLALATAVLAAGVWILWHHDPNAPHSRFPPCVFLSITGFFCPGCGITRALHALVHGDLARAFAMNPVALVIMPLIPLMLLHARGFQPRWLRPVMTVAMEPKLWIVAIPAYWIARNLPWWPFAWMAPG
jgi:hypothetical protein